MCWCQCVYAYVIIRWRTFGWPSNAAGTKKHKAHLTDPHIKRRSHLFFSFFFHFIYLSLSLSLFFHSFSHSHIHSHSHSHCIRTHFLFSLSVLRYFQILPASTLSHLIYLISLLSVSFHNSIHNTKAKHKKTLTLSRCPYYLVHSPVCRYRGALFSCCPVPLTLLSPQSNLFHPSERYTPSRSFHFTHLRSFHLVRSCPWRSKIKFPFFPFSFIQDDPTTFENHR